MRTWAWRDHNDTSISIMFDHPGNGSLIQSEQLEAFGRLFQALQEVYHFSKEQIFLNPKSTTVLSESLNTIQSILGL
jgi:hypothetical protein